MADETPDEPSDAPAEAEAEAGETPEPEPEPEPEPGAITSPSVQALFDRLEAELGADVVTAAESFGTLVVRVARDAWPRAAAVAKQKLECDYLSFISGVDWMPMPKAGGDEAGGDTSQPVQPTEQTPGLTGADGRFQVFAHVISTRRHYGITFKTDVADDAPSVPTWVGVYPGADWHERECWEMYGIDFEGRDDMRHLYLPYEFEGNPLRKDFPLLARIVKPWPGLVDVEPMLGEDEPAEATADAGDAS